MQSLFTNMAIHQTLFIVLFLFGVSTAPPTSAKCPKNHFECVNGRCIPLTVVCDKKNDCGDGSDEVMCETTEIEIDPSAAAVAAAQYLLTKRNSDEDWSSRTPRVHIALSFIDEKYFKISEEEKVAMKEKLNLQLLFLLHKGIRNVPLQYLATHVNAQHATCQDPSDFQGNDLLEVLRVKTDEAMESGDLNPIVFLALCISRDTRIEDSEYLIDLYDKKNDNIGFKALTLIAMSSCKKLVTKSLLQQMKARAEDFIKRFKVFDDFSIYTKALILQAFNAWNHYDENLHYELLRLQADDGSFGDIITTCVTIPALVKKSWADLECKTRNYEVRGTRSITSLAVYNPGRNTDYTLAIPSGQNKGNHTLRLSIEGKKSLFELMKLAQQQNPLFTFECEKVEGTRKVVSLAGIHNDIESGITWQLYRKSVDSDKNVVKESGSIDWLYPEDKDHIIFKLEGPVL